MQSQIQPAAYQQAEVSALLQLANRQVLQERMVRESVIKEAMRRVVNS